MTGSNRQLLATAVVETEQLLVKRGTHWMAGIPGSDRAAKDVEAGYRALYRFW